MDGIGRWKPPGRAIVNGVVAHFRERLSTGYWLVPGLMVTGYLGLAAVMLHADDIRPQLLVSVLSWFAVPGAEGSRAVLAAIAGSMVTVAATVFSITMLTLSSASQQFGARVLRNFMRNRWNQITLGTFTGTFAYALLVLRTAGRKHEGEFVPNLSVSVGVLLALVAVLVLVLFIHHVSVQIQGPTVVERVARELDGAIDEFFPDKLGHEEDAHTPFPLPDARARECLITGTGYVDAVGDTALKLASEHRLVVEFLVQPGDFVVEGQLCARAWPPERVPDDVANDIARGFVLSRTRTAAQDPGFTIGQLTEIASRALSRGINDPFTATVCVDYLGAALIRLAGRRIPSPYRVRGEGVVVTPRPGFPELLALACDPLHEYGSSHQMVVLRMAHMLARLAHTAGQPANRTAVLHHLMLVRLNAERCLGSTAAWPRVRRELDEITTRAAASPPPR